MNRSARWLGQAMALALIVAASLLVWSPSASADPVYGTQSISYSGVANPPTSDKPQSKLWWNDGSWWADMWTTGSGWHIYRLDRGTHTWVDSGLLNDSRGSTLADTLWDGTHLYIASHVVGVSTNSNPVDSVGGQPAYLYRYSYAAGKYTLDSGFPTVITDHSSESMTIDEDSTGAIWATWTQVAGNATSGYTNTVYVNNSAPSGTGWGAPFVIPVSNPNASPDDISAVIAFGKNKIGVMWSDQLTGTVWWATRTDGSDPSASSSWKLQPAIRGNGQADDHLNIKSLQSDPSGRVFAAVKTSLNDVSSDPTLPQLLLLVFKPGTGAFTQSTISTTGDCVTRPQILLDTQNNLVHAFQTAPPTSVSGCAYSGVAGSIYEKTAPMDNPTFGPGRGTPIIQSASSSNMNDLTTTKQGVNGTTGLVVMATDDVAKNYWFADESLAAATAPVASFTAAPPYGTAPLDVSFTDTSTGTPTSWAWDFGDGGTSTAQNPAHSYAMAGTYTAKLTATNSTGSSQATTTITATAPAPPPAPGTGDWTEKLIAAGDVNGDGIPDLVQRQADGTLWFHPGDGTGKFGAGQRIGDFGWQVYDQIVGVGDYNGDGHPDLVARNSDGSLWLYPGTGHVDASSKGFAPGVKIGLFGWNAFDTILGVGDFDGDGHPDLVARKTDGTLWLYAGTGSGQPGPSRQIDFGWNIFDKLVASHDFNGDGTNDLMGRKPDGTLWFYSNTGAATLVNGRQIGTGWDIYGDIVGVGDANKDGHADLVARQPDGSVYLYAGTGAVGGGYLAPATKIGDFGWEAFDKLVNVRDFNGDGKSDLLARKPDGTLWFYPGTGTGGYGPPTKIGNFGWDAFDALVGAGDFNGDGKNDLIARKPDGTLWLYPGTGHVDATSNGYAAAVKIGDFGWNAYDALIGSGDLNGDGKNDLIARKPDGTLWSYPGTGIPPAVGYLGRTTAGNF